MYDHATKQALLTVLLAERFSPKAACDLLKNARLDEANISTLAEAHRAAARIVLEDAQNEAAEAITVLLARALDRGQSGQPEPYMEVLKMASGAPLRTPNGLASDLHTAYELAQEELLRA